MEVPGVQLAPKETGNPYPPNRLWNRDFRFLWRGQAVSQFGNQALLVAMGLWIKEVTGSAALMGYLMALFYLPALFAPFGGTFADRHSRVRIIVICDILAGVVSLGLGLSLFIAAEATTSAAPVKAGDAIFFLLPLLFGAILLIGSIRAFFMPAIQAAIPDLVPRDDLIKANSYSRIPGQLAKAAGQFFGGIIYKILGAPLMFIIDGLSSLFAGFSSTFITDRWEKPSIPARGFLHETKAGLRDILKDRAMRELILVACLANVLSAPIFVLLPFYADKAFGTGGAGIGYGFLLGAISIGMAAGHVLTIIGPFKGPIQGWRLVSCLAVGQLFLSALGFVSNPWVALALCLGGGLSLGVFTSYLLTLSQKLAPDTLGGRVQGLLAALVLCLYPIGAALGGWLGDLTKKDFPVIFGWVGVLTVVGTLALATRREFREFLVQKT